MRLKNPIDVLLFLSALAAMGACAWLTSGGEWRFQEDARYVCYFVVAWLAVRLRITLRSSNESYSMCFVFVLIALVELNLSQTLVVSCCAIVIDVICEKALGNRMPSAWENLLSTAAAAVGSQWAYRSLPLDNWLEWPVRLVVASTVCFVAGNAPLVIMNAWNGDAHWRRLMRSLYVFTFPYYIVVAMFTAIYAAVVPFVHWYATAALVPLMLVVHHSLKRYALQVDRHRAEAENLSALQMRTMEALAAAMEKEAGSHEHLTRMRIYAVELGKALGLAASEIEALRAAAILHDIGKLAVPDHITCKTGGYTAEELEKIRIHSTIGERIVHRVNFPYPVAPLVRSHHENWDGSGYPDGLAGENIPLGGRILAVVDALDSLVTSRARTITLAQAVEQLSAGAGTRFDPRIIKILKRKYSQIEQIFTAAAQSVIDQGPAKYLASIGAARGEMSALFKLHDQLMRALSTVEIAHALRTGFRDLVPYDALAVYTGSTPDAKADVVCGDRSAIRRARSKLILNLPEIGGSAGRMELYSLLKDRLTESHLRTARTILPRIAQALDNLRRYQATSDSAATDFLTKLPNAQSLFARLKQELENAAHGGTEIAVLMCDLDGFKAVNDTLGHLAGNRVLQEVAQAFRAHTRDVDYVARLGGDEFVLILPGMSRDAVEARISGLRRVVKDAGMRGCGASVIGASFGAARFPHDGSECDDLVAVADQRMYEEKRRRHSQAEPFPVETPEVAEQIM